PQKTFKPGQKYPVPALRSLSCIVIISLRRGRAYATSSSAGSVSLYSIPRDRNTKVSPQSLSPVFVLEQKTRHNLSYCHPSGQLQTPSQISRQTAMFSEELANQVTPRKSLRRRGRGSRPALTGKHFR
ncbi:hypothetical protein BaRGS_00006559, partial [Batillaria attramentaria]